MPNIASSFDDFLLGEPFAIVLNTEGLYFLLRDAVFREIVVGSDLVFVDGIGLRVVLNFCGYSHARRIHGPDLFHEMLHRYDGRRRMVLGGTEKAHSLLFEKYPKLYSSKERFFCADQIDTDNIEPIIDMVESYRPDEIYVCLGIRKQELLGKRLRDHFPEISIVGLGAAIDFESGNVERSSLFIRKMALEWLPRLIKEPRMIPRVLRSLYGLMFFLLAKIVNRKNPFVSYGFDDSKQDE